MWNSDDWSREISFHRNVLEFKDFLEHSYFGGFLSVLYHVSRGVYWEIRSGSSVVSLILKSLKYPYPDYFTWIDLIYDVLPIWQDIWILYNHKYNSPGFNYDPFKENLKQNFILQEDPKHPCWDNFVNIRFLVFYCTSFIRKSFNLNRNDPCKKDRNRLIQHFRSPISEWQLRRIFFRHFCHSCFSRSLHSVKISIKLATIRKLTRYSGYSPEIGEMSIPSPLWGTCPKTTRSVEFTCYLLDSIDTSGVEYVVIKRSWNLVQVSEAIGDLELEIFAFRPFLRTNYVFMLLIFESIFSSIFGWILDNQVSSRISWFPQESRQLWEIGW